MIELLLYVLLFFVLVMGVGGALALRTAAGWSREWQELRDHGVAATGTVIEKRRIESTRHRSTHIRYEYMDQFGNRHASRRVLVTPEAWAAHEEGGPIQIIYSQKRPGVSWPRYLFDLGPKR